MIPRGQRYNLDHIVPKALFTKVAADRKNEFGQDWNCQPMHEACNSSKGFQWREWPKFGCKCHYLQVLDGGLHICTRGKAHQGSHLLLADVVSDFAESPDRVDARVVPGSHKDPTGRRIAGYVEGRFGFVLLGIHARQVEMFNLEEQGRVGLPAPKYIYRDEQGRVTPVRLGGSR